MTSPKKAELSPESIQIFLRALHMWEMGVRVFLTKFIPFLPGMVAHTEAPSEAIVTLDLINLT